jgi:hypothetical protein
MCPVYFVNHVPGQYRGEGPARVPVLTYIEAAPDGRRQRVRPSLRLSAAGLLP